MAWKWLLEDVGGNAVDGGSPSEFSTQSDAETWIGESWRDLADAGVAQASLFEDDRLVYGPMSFESE
jgi:hypothetical protein